MHNGVQSAFRMKRPLITSNGFISDVDRTAGAHLDELNELLGKRIFEPDMGGRAAASGAAAKTGGPPFTVPVAIAEKLAPKHVPPVHGGCKWEAGSLLDDLSKAAESDVKITLAEHIDMTPELSKLKYAFQNQLNNNWLTLDANSKAVLEGYPAIQDYLVAYAFHVMHHKDVQALGNMILQSRRGAQAVADYAIVSGARSIIERDQLVVKDYNDNKSKFVELMRAPGIRLSAASFEKTANERIRTFVFDSDEESLVENAKLGDLPPKYKTLLVQYIKSSAIPITPQNADRFLPVFASQIMRTQGFSDPIDSTADPVDEEFAVQFRDDSTATPSISRAAVNCAANLYHGMVVGDELDVFGAVNYFTHKYLLRGNMEITAKQLRSDLRMYVFSNQFIDLQSGKITERTRPAERQMFYRQVFSQGRADVTEDVIVNEDFGRLWKVLMLESAKYLQRAQASPHPDSFVSRQNVMQAVEDLQYNLSTNCTGMVNIIAPLIDAELNFVLSRILSHPEVIRHVSPSGGNWQRVVETLSAQMKKARPRANTMYNKARFGENILRSIASYDPSSFEDDRSFSAFISQVDAFITTQSILQGSYGEEAPEVEEEDAYAEGDEAPEPEMIDSDEPVSVGTKPNGNEWNF
jgi:hypothetical protein